MNSSSPWITENAVDTEKTVIYVVVYNLIHFYYKLIRIGRFDATSNNTLYRISVRTHQPYQQHKQHPALTS